MLTFASMLIALGGAALAQSAPPSGLQLAQGPWKLTVHPTLGAQWMTWVGDEARARDGDPALAEGVRLAQTALDLQMQGPAGAFATLRGEEGLAQGDPDALEAWVGVALAGGRGGVWIGQNDLPVTRDRGRENDGLALSWRPVLSTRAAALHPAGAGGGVAVPGRLSLRGGVAYDQVGVDAPMLWGRLDLHPLGAPPDRQDQRVERVAFLLGGGALRHRSSVVGDTGLWTGDLEVRLGPVELAGAWVGLWETSTGGVERASAEWILTAGTVVAPLPSGDLHLQARAERISGLWDEGEVRWVPTGRLSWRAGDGALEAYVESRLSFEVPAATLPPDSADRSTGVAGVGLVARW